MIKVNKSEVYHLELDKEEFMFLLEVFDKMQLDPEKSSPKAFEFFEKFKYLNDEFNTKQYNNKNESSDQSVNIEESVIFNHDQ